MYTIVVSNLQFYPTGLKVPNVIPILKRAKDARDVESYRPISLLNGIAKEIDQIILERLHTHETNKLIIWSEQYGSIAGHSTVAQVVRIAHPAKKAFNNK